MTATSFYTATIDGRKVLLYAAVGACVVLAAAMVLQPEHAAAANKIVKFTNDHNFHPAHTGHGVAHFVWGKDGGLGFGKSVGSGRVYQIGDTFNYVPRDPQHLETAGKLGKTGHFIHKEIGRSQLGKGIAHKAVNILRDGHDTTINGKTLTTYRYQTLFPQHGTPTSPEMLKDAFKEYAKVYGDFGRKLLHIIREIGLRGARGEFPYAPPGFFHVGPGVGPGLPF